MDLARELAAALPDEPIWVETRAMLLSGHAQISGGGSVAEGFAVRVAHGAVSAAAVVGAPPCAAIRAAVEGTTDLTPLIAQAAGTPHIAACLGRAGSWSHQTAIVHLRREAIPRPAPRPHPTVRVLTVDDDLTHLPPGLRHEMVHALDMAPVAGVFVDGRAASFCYPVWITEAFWDVSVDTLEAYRGQALAARAFWLMADLMGERGRQPVWGALRSNTASLRLAEKLGFTPVGEISVFSRGEWVFMSGGFTGP